MESTEVPSQKTASEITTLLVQSGAREISVQYDEGKISGLRFVLLAAGNVPLQFALPVRTEPIFKIINGRRQNYGQFSKVAMQERDHEQAERVAWRQLLRWMQAQLAFIETGMVASQEVFLPYLLHAGSGQTLFQYFEGEGFKQIAGAK
jgi:hypothetical protein